MTTERRSAKTMLVSTVREDVCLGYANTLSWRGSDTPAERLGDVADLLDWAAEAAGLAANTHQEFGDWSRDHPAKAARLFAEAIAIREVIYRIFSALAVGDPVRDQDLAVLNHAFAAAPARRRLARLASGYTWRIECVGMSAPALLAPVLWSAGDLMTKGKHRRIRQCANEKCLWLFLDESKSGTRRWCDMTSCGNRAKARRHYLKIKRG